MRIANGKERKGYAVNSVRALLDETRLALVSSLLQKPRHISDLAKSVNSDRATVSYHLKILEDIGFVESRYVMLQEPRLKGKVGRVYTVNRTQLKRALDALQQRLARIET